MASRVDVQSGLCYPGEVCVERESAGESKWPLYLSAGLTITVFLAAFILAILFGKAPPPEIVGEFGEGAFGFPFYFL